MKLTSALPPTQPPRKPAPPVDEETARMEVGQAIQKAVGQLKAKFPVKSVQERTLENMSKEDKNASGETDPEVKEGDAAPATASAGSTGSSVDTHA